MPRPATSWRAALLTVRRSSPDVACICNAWWEDERSCANEDAVDKHDVSVRRVGLIQVSDVPVSKAVKQIENVLETPLLLVKVVEVDFDNDGPRLLEHRSTTANDPIVISLCINLHQNVGFQTHPDSSK